MAKTIRTQVTDNRAALCAALFLSLGSILLACRSLVKPSSVPNPAMRTPTPCPEPTCYLQPQVTMEHYTPVVVETPAPQRARPGETIRLQLSGGYLILNYAQICGEDTIVGYVYADKLPSFTTRRTIYVDLDHERIAEVDCDYECLANIRIPDNVTPGEHQLALSAVFGFRLDLDLEIVEAE